MRELLNRRDFRFLVVCGAVLAASLFIVLNYFSSAFPEASIEFRYDRDNSGTIAQRVLREQGLDVRGMKHSATFDDDDNAKIFLERSLGLDRANVVMRRDVHLWFWHHRWFRPLQEEELAVDVAPTGEIVTFSHKLPEDRAVPTPDASSARSIAESFLTRNGVLVPSLQLVAQSERTLPKRLQRIFTWESKAIRPAGAPYRYDIVVDGNAVGDYAQRLRVPDDWQRSYHELRSKNAAASRADLIFLAITMVAAVAVFVIRLRRGDLRVQMLLGIGCITIVLVTLNALNSFPSALAGYETTTSYAAFLTQFAAFAIVLPSLGAAMILLVIVGSGEVLYRERLPNQLAIPRLWTPRALASKRVFLSFVLGYTLVAFFLAYQVAFYLIAGRFGAWAPAEIPYDATLNTALPWVAVLFAGWFPALSEEFMSRAFSIPFFERILRSRVAAVVVSGFIWGFGHAGYPNQPFFIRGLEVGLAGCVLGFIFLRFGLLPLLIWHYTVDALYTALLLFRSHNTYYIVSSGAASLIFMIPMLISIVLYVRNRGFMPDGDLSNETLPISPPPAKAEASPTVIQLPPPIELKPGRVTACVVTVAIAVALVVTRGPSPDDAIDYRITKAEAKQIAGRHLTEVAHQRQPQRVIATPLAGFRNWDRESGREEGGSPDGFDSVAADYLVRHGLTRRQLVEIFRTRVQAGTWTVRFFTPLQKVEDFIEVDPRTSRVIGYHKYQDERAPGPRLDQASALTIANDAFGSYGLDVRAFELKEALAFQQPNRRDWLFHFQDKTPLTAEGYRRVSVRVAGNEVTEVTTTVKVPDAVYREAEQRTLLNVVFTIMKIVGTIGILSLIVTGFVVVTRQGNIRWWRAARWTIVFAIVPLSTMIATYESRLFSYNTSVQWQTFRFDIAVDFIRTIGLQAGVFFLAVAALEAAFPFGPALLSREGRLRFGRAAVIAAITGLGILLTARMVLQILASFFPSIASVPPVDAPNDVATAMPGLFAVAEAAFSAIVISGAIALFAVAVRALPYRPWVAPLCTILAVFSVELSPGVAPHAAPLMLLSALLIGIAAWIVVRHVAGANFLAYPLAVFIATILLSAATLLPNHRADLIASGVSELVILGAALLWIVTPKSAAHA
jgi:membrane protease YdiL (CAAX protease family)